MHLFRKDEATAHTAIPLPEHLRRSQKIAILTADKAEDTELFYPYYRFTEEGYQVHIITPHGGRLETQHRLGLAHTHSITSARPERYALLYIPGGKAPAELRKNTHVLDFLRRFSQSAKPIAAICHGPQILISAGLVAGQHMACAPQIAHELEAAGGIYVDQPCVEDGKFTTARMPGDLPWHLYSILHRLAGYGHSMQSAA